MSLVSDIARFMRFEKIGMNRGFKCPACDGPITVRDHGVQWLDDGRGNMEQNMVYELRHECSKIMYMGDDAIMKIWSNVLIEDIEKASEYPLGSMLRDAQLGIDASEMIAKLRDEADKGVRQ